ncbi:MAG: response regulator [Holophagaceae bacterium]|nr:response regulator [Holophagaceae bacterium]
MPRLLLVDDNPSIHKIAETLLGSSSIELYCVGSASEALMLLDSGERFDVALLDTAMPVMDGWELLSRMRKHPDSAYIPIAMMAGVLDTVDPEKLKHAPIQGFIKKPIELRELAERVQHLLATPVTLAEPAEAEADPTVLSPFSTVPGTKIKSLPEFRGVVDGPPPPEVQRGVAAFDDVESGPDEQDDLLLLTPEDFWFEDAPLEPGSPDFLQAQAAAEAMAQVEHEAPTPPVGAMDATLDLEELDLEALKDLPSEAAPTLPEVGEAEMDFQAPPAGELPAVDEAGAGLHAEPPLAAQAPAFTDEMLEEDTLAIPGLATYAQAIAARAPEAPGFPPHEVLSEDIPAHALADLGEAPDFETIATEMPDYERPAQPVFEEALPQAEFHEDSAFPSVSAYALPAVSEPAPGPTAVPMPAPAIAMPTPGLPVAASGGELPRDAGALVQVLMSDPVLMDALAKAVVARLGDQALREIAWELMPELAEKLPR